MSLAVPFHSFYHGPVDENLGLANKLQMNRLLLHPPVQSNGYGRVLRCSIQPLENIQSVGKSVLTGPEGERIQSDGAPKSATWRCLPDIWRTAAEKYGDRIALFDPHHQPVTRMSYEQLRQAIKDFAEGLQVTGISPGEKVALFAENSCRWLVADQGIMTAGAIDVVRGTRSSIEELLFIYGHSESVAVVVDNSDLYDKLIPQLQKLSNLKFVVVLWGEKPEMTKDSSTSSLLVFTYDEILSKGREYNGFSTNTGDLFSIGHRYIEPEDIATLVYTSGTTGNPKGVILTHRNLLYQVQHLTEVVDLKPGDRFLSLLPTWHMYERSSEYFCLAQGVEQVYTNVKNLKEDLRKFCPDYLISVPLVLDTLYNGVQKKLLAGSSTRKFIALTLIRISMVYMEWKRIYEGRSLQWAKVKPTVIVSACMWLFARILAAVLFPLHILGRKLVYRKIHEALAIKKAAISGGGSLAPHVDKFFEAVEITVLNGYGLTETSPVISVRVPSNNILGTVGKPLHETEIKAVNPESGEELPHGERGLIKAFGPQVMKGYYKNDAATAKAIDTSGWFDTGDLGWIVPHTKSGPARYCGGSLVLDGRAKDTIVLSTGENIDPIQIEEAALQSRYIQQIMIVGQDKRRLGALIVPSKEDLHLLPSTNVRELLRKELSKFTADCPARIGPFILLHEPFTVENGLLTPTMKMRRNAIADMYVAEIEALFQES